MSSRAFQFSQAANTGINVLPDLGAFTPAPGDVVSAETTTSGKVTLRFNPPGGGGGGSGYLPMTGGILIGPLTLAGPPTVGLHAATKAYVDAAPPVGGPFLPLAGGTVSGNLTVSGVLTASGSSILGSTTAAALQRYDLRALPGNELAIRFFNANLANWALIRDNTALGNNLGAKFGAAAYNDAGGFISYLWQGSRGSGPTGAGASYFPIMRPYVISGASRATSPGGVTGNDVNASSSDVQPTTTLAADPLATTSGSPIVTVTWVGSGVASGSISASYDTWVLLSGATAVGGITPTGWLRATRVGNDSFTVTWTSNATSTATGGGLAVTVQPSFVTSNEKHLVVVKTGAAGFPMATQRLFVADPAFYQAGSGVDNAQYQQEWRMVFGPNDPSPVNTNRWGIVGTELDLINRGPDPGYAPNLFAAPNPTIGYWAGCWASIPSFVSSGGTPTNWNTVYAVFAYAAGQNYVGFSVQGNALVGAARDPTGHGGVGYVGFGSYTAVASGRCTTTNGSGVVTIGANCTLQVTGGSVYIPTVQTINGVTFGGSNYVMANVTAGSFQITGTGTASSSGSGGAGQWIAFINTVPYAPMELRGRYKRGISTTEFLSEDGSIIHTQPGNRIVWDDGTASASVTGAVVSAGNVDVVLAPAGTGGVRVTGPLTMNGGFGVWGTASPAAKPSVTGSRGGNAALADLLTKLVSYGLLTDGTTA